MRGTLRGRQTDPAIAAVGVWDPFLPSHATLLTELRDYARESRRCSLAIVIDPSPGTLSPFSMRYGVSGWPVYDVVAARTRFMLDLGLDAVLVMRLTRPNFGATAAEFLDGVRRYATLDELWLGAMQLLGPGRAGSREAVADYAARHDLRLTILPRPPVYLHDVRALLASGRLAEASAVVGHPPVRHRPRSGTMRVAWKPGVYRALPGGEPECVGEGTTLNVHLVAQRHGAPRLTWPNRGIRHLAFVAGPSDREPIPERPPQWVAGS